MDYEEGIDSSAAKVAWLSGPGKPGVLDRSLSYQGFSIKGRHRMSHGRNQLFDACYVLRVSLVKAENGLQRSA